jgi:hypothetical protein
MAEIKELLPNEVALNSNSSQGNMPLKDDASGSKNHRNSMDQIMESAMKIEMVGKENLNSSS